MFRTGVFLLGSASLALTCFSFWEVTAEEVEGLSPLPSVVWEVPAPNDLGHQQAVDDQRRYLLKTKTAPIPTSRPLVVDVPVKDKPHQSRRLILVRSAERLLLINAENGQRVAFYPAASEISKWSVDLTEQKAQEREAVELRSWRNELYGSITSDSNSVYLVDNSPGPKRKPHSPLVALDLQRDGAMTWSIGGEDGGDEPKLAGASFLGPPLIRSNRLVAIVRQKDHVRLIELDKEKGTLKRSIDCLDLTDMVVPVEHWEASYSPVASGKRLLVPLPGGGVTCTAPMEESPLWIYKADPPKRIRADWVFPARRGHASYRKPSHSQPLVSGDSIVIPHSADDRLVCLNIHDGTVRWKAKRAVLYLASIDAESVIVVTQSGIVALKLVDGTPVWERELGDAKLPSGRGLLHKQHYYLPTSDGQLHKIDLATGKLVKSVAMGTALGNLTRDGDRLISYDGARVQSFYIAEALARRVDARLKEQPDDAWALARQGELALAAGDAEGALRWLRRSLAQEKADDTRQSIVAVTLQLMRADAKQYVESGESALTFAEEPQERTELLRRIALGYADSGQPREAFAYCLQLADELDKQPASARPIFVELEPGHRVSIDRWLQAMIARLERKHHSH